jgi:DNA repair exonuclease SbcCD nuclease subunit
MKILLTADWHFHDTNRLEDFVASTEKMVNYAIDNKIKHIFIVGDMYFNWKPSTAERTALHAVLAKAIFAGIDVVIIMGNHDVNEKEQRFIQHSLSEFVAISSDKITLVYSKPRGIILKDGDRSYTVYMIPHLSKAYLATLHAKGPTSYKDAFLEAVTQGNPASLILSHTLVMDAIDGPATNEERGLSLADFKTVLMTNMFMGDIHGHKILQESPLVGYISSPERITFNEIDDLKGFVVFDLASQEYEFVPLNTRKFFQLTMDLNKCEFKFQGVGEPVSEPMGQGDRTDIAVAILKAAKEMISDAVVKLVIIGHKSELNLINRHAVINQLKLCNPFKIVKVAFESTDDTVARDVTFNGHMTAQDAFKKWAEKQTYEDKTLGEAVFAAGLEILNEA